MTREEAPPACPVPPQEPDASPPPIPWPARIFRSATLVAVLILIGLLALTAALARWFHTERLRRAEADFELGTKLAQAGNSARALDLYRGALSVSRSNRRYRLAFALELMKLKRLNEAEIYLEDLLQSDPSNAVPNLMLARIAVSRHKTDAAIDYYNRAIYGNWSASHDQNRARTRWELIELLTKEGRTKDAVAELLKSAAEQPGDLALKLRIGTMLLKLGSRAQAADMFREVTRESGPHHEGYAGLGEAEFALGNYQAAQRALARAVRTDPGDEASRRRLQLVEGVLNLDPTLRGLTSQERYRRSLTLLKRTTASLNGCAAKPLPADTPATNLLAQAGQATAARVRPGAYGDAADRNTALAEQLWAARRKLCGSPAASGPLPLVFSHLAR